jgi:anti-repressor protein
MEQKFEFNSMPVRISTDNEEQSWFAGVDICAVLGYADSYQKIKSLDEDEYRLDRIIDGQGKMKDTLTVNEFGLYSLILTSTKPEAKAFKRWVTHEVLPAIRKAGKYTTEEEIEHDLSLTTLAKEIKYLKEKRDYHQKAINDMKKEIDSKTTEMISVINMDRKQLRLPFTQ